MAYIKHLTNPPQSEPLYGKQQVENSAGGYVFQIDPFERLQRFLVLGCEGGTYYASEQKLTIQNAGCVNECLALDAPRTISTIVSVSQEGRAPKNDPAIFALALAACHSDADTRAMALSALNSVCRIGTHLFQFVEAVDGLRGWGRSLRRAVGQWYTAKTPDTLALQVTKYAQRGGWSHRDVLRLSHPKDVEPGQREVFEYVTHNDRWTTQESKHPLLAAVEDLQTSPDPAALIRQHGLVREHLPTERLNELPIWAALLEGMPVTATLRNLGKMTSLGLLKPLADATKMVCDRLTSEETLRKGRVHPFSVLLAMKTYESGQGFRGSLRWQPVPQIVAALEEAFYKSFQTVEPTGKKWLFGVDVSGSMAMAAINNSNVTPRAAAACLAMVNYRIEAQAYAFGFAGRFVDLEITPKMSLPEVEQRTSSLAFGRTDCAVPMLHAAEHKLEVDAFVVLTDNETWAGSVHPCVALQRYRDQMGRDAKLVVVGMTSTGFSIADPADKGCLDVVGFDAAAPAVIADFIR